MGDSSDAGRRGWMLAVLRRYEGPLVRYAARITGDVDRGRDVAQETFLRLWKSRGSVAREHLGQWLFTVCRNRAVDVLRKEGRMSMLTEQGAEFAPSRQPGPAELAQRHEDAAAAMRALQALPPNQQEVIRLRLEEGFSYRQIAAITKLTVSNVGFLIHTALKRIRRQLGADA